MKSGKRKTVKKTARRTVAIAAAAQTTPAKDKTFTRVLIALRIFYRAADGLARLRIFHPLTLPVFAVYLPVTFVRSIVRTAWAELKAQYTFVIKIMRPYSDSALVDLVVGVMFVAEVSAVLYFVAR